MRRKMKLLGGILVLGAMSSFDAQFVRGATDATYNGTAGNWSVGTDWTSTPSPDTAPNGEDDTARAKAEDTSTTLDTAVTLGTLTQGNPNTWTINASGGNAFTFDVTSGSAAISTTDAGGSLIINPNIVINDDLAVSSPASPTGLITLNGSITGTSDRKIISTGSLVVTGNNSATYDGLWVAGTGLNGTLRFNSLNAIGTGGANNKIATAFGGVVVADFAMNQGFIDRIHTSTTAINGQAKAVNGVVALGVNSSTDLVLSNEFALLAQVNLGATTGTVVTYSGTLSIDSTSSRFYKLGGGGGTLIISKQDGLSQTVGTRGLNVGGTSLIDAQTATSVVEISATQSFTGNVSIEGGTLRTNSLANGGVVSGLGKSSNAVGSLVFNSDSAAVPSILEYSGSADASTNRLFTLGRHGVGQILNNGTGTVNFTNPGSMANTTTTTSVQGTFTLGGSNAGNNTMSVRLIDSTGAGTKSLALIKKDAGKWIVANNNTYSGGTTINGGTLQVAATGTLGAGDVSVADGAIFRLDGATSIADTATLTLGTGALLDLQFATASTEQIAVLVLGGTTFASPITFNAANNYNGMSAFFTDGGAGFQGSLQVVPEPTGFGLIGLGAMVLIRRRRR